MISDTVLIALITAVPSTLAALGALWVSVRNGQKIEVVRHATNSLTEQLVAVTASDSERKGRADGIEQGVAEEKARSTQ